jgi:hypothetical protein
MRFLCKVGLHIPIKKISYLFTDYISKKRVYEYKCKCGKHSWMCTSILDSFFFKVKK